MRQFLILLALASIAFSTGAAAFEKPPFPRLAAHWIDNQNYQDPQIRKDLSRGTVALIAVWPNWDAGRGISVENVIKDIKSMNPKTMVFNYLINNELPQDRNAYQMFSELYQKADQMNWWVYQNGSSGTIVPAPWPGTNSLNNTLFAPTDSNGDHWVEYFAKWAYRTYAVPNPSLDGFYMDNFTWKPMINADWNRDGTSDNGGGAYQQNGQWLFDRADAQAWQRQSYRKHIETLNQLMPGKYQMGNVANWGDPNSILTEYEGLLNGGYMEGMIGYSWSVETWGGWQQTLDWYRKTMKTLGEPKLGLFMQYGPAGDYQNFRYGLATCLMDDGYYVFNTEGQRTDSPYFDEYSVNLGQATSAPPTSAYQQGVYRRDFENGIALVNPKGNGAKTITLEGDFKRFSGSQAPGVNNGQTVRTLTLQDRDGIILLRTSVQTKPAPPANVTVQ